MEVLKRKLRTKNRQIVLNDLPDNFNNKDVEVIVLTADDENSTAQNISRLETAKKFMGAGKGSTYEVKKGDEYNQ